jgi:hypothetical protein
MMTNKKLEELIAGLNSYIENGYVEVDSYNDPDDDALEYIIELSHQAEDKAFKIYKSVLEAKGECYSFMKAICMNRLLLSEKEGPYAFDYLLNKTDNVSIPALEKALFYFYCAKNETDPHPVPEGLFKKLMARYQEVKDDPDANFYHLHETYNDFVKAYALDLK